MNTVRLNGEIEFSIIYYNRTISHQGGTYRQEAMLQSQSVFANEIQYLFETPITSIEILNTRRELIYELQEINATVNHISEMIDLDRRETVIQLTFSGDEYVLPSDGDNEPEVIPVEDAPEEETI